MFWLSIKKPLGTFSLFVTPYDKCNINKRDSYLTKNIFTYMVCGLGFSTFVPCKSTDTW